MFQIPYRNNLSSFNLSNERTTHLLSLLIVIIYFLFFFSFSSFFLFLFFFPCHVIFAHDVLSGIFALPLAFSPIFCLDCPFGFSIQHGSFALTFTQAALPSFQPSRFFFLFLSNVISSISNFRTKSYSLRFLGFTFLLNALVMLFQYPCEIGRAHV